MACIVSLNISIRKLSGSCIHLFTTGGMTGAAFCAEVSWDDAIKYLKKEVLLLPAEIEKGYVLVYYQGFPLGFVKHLGNRANNLYPQEWRIRTGYMPEQIQLLTD